MSKLMPLLLFLTGIGAVVGWLLHRREEEADSFREDFLLD